MGTAHYGVVKYRLGCEGSESEDSNADADAKQDAAGVLRALQWGRWGA